MLKKFVPSILLGVLLLYVGTTLSAASAPSQLQTTSGSEFYVSRQGNNSNGSSWETAWNELDQIDWSKIGPGDVIYLDGGTDQMTYHTEMRINKSGDNGNPIRIQVSEQNGYNGQVVFFGGREELLPACGENSFDDSAEDTYKFIGIATRGNDNIVIDGMKWSGIQIHGYNRNGIDISPDSENILVRNVEIYNNGQVVRYDGNLRTDSPGVRLGGTNIVFQRAIIHDNGQDAFQNSGTPDNLHNFTLEDSWLYNGRPHPTRPNESFNNCTHTDGIQIYGGGVISGINLRNSIIGPGFMQNLILGQTPNTFGEWAAVQDVVMEDLLLVKPNGNNIYGYSNTDSQNWNINRVTVYCPNTGGQCLQIHNSNHSVTNSIFVEGNIYLPDGLDHYEGNCVWHLNSSTISIGENINPKFKDVSPDPFSLDDYALASDSGCQGKGSRLTSVDQLLGTDAVTEEFPEDNTTLTGFNASDWRNFTFSHVPGAEWYYIWIGTPDYSHTYLADWFPATDNVAGAGHQGGICNTVTRICKLPRDVWLTNGQYSFWMTHWSPSSPNYTETWSETSFTVNFSPPQPSFDVHGLTGTLTHEPVSFSWNRDPDALWYHLWIGPEDYSAPVYYDWVNATDICTRGTCTLDVGSLPFPNGSYEIWAQIWGPNGYIDWTEVTNTPRRFTVAKGGG